MTIQSLTKHRWLFEICLLRWVDDRPAPPPPPPPRAFDEQHDQQRQHRCAKRCAQLGIQPPLRAAAIPSAVMPNITINTMTPTNLAGESRTQEIEAGQCVIVVHIVIAAGGRGWRWGGCEQIGKQGRAEAVHVHRHGHSGVAKGHRGQRRVAGRGAHGFFGIASGRN